MIPKSDMRCDICGARTAPATTTVLMPDAGESIVLCELCLATIEATIEVALKENES